MLGRSLRLTAQAAHAVSWRAADAADVLDPPPGPQPHPEYVAYRDLHRGRRAFVIGNGPSLARQDLSLLQGELLFTMNAFDRHPLCRLFLPVYHFLADPEYNDGSPQHEAELERIAKGVGDSTLFIPVWPPCSAQLRRMIVSGQAHPISLWGSLANGPLTEVDMCRSLPNVMNVAQLALMVAVYMGCDPIYLTGVDSDWAASHDLDRHFYDERTLDESWDWDYERILEMTLTVFRGYRFLADFCRGRNIRVYNCTDGGLLDVFPRKSLEDAVREA